MAASYEEVRAELRSGGVRPAHPYRFEAHRAAARLRARRAQIARRRLVVVATLVAVVGMSLFGGGNSIASKPGAPRAVILHRGDTVWEVAVKYAPEGTDVRAYVDAIYELNDLVGLPDAGLKIKLPGRVS